MIDNKMKSSQRICIYGNDVLRKKAEPVAEVTDAVRELADAMIDTMHRAQGVGLAAEQVGRTEALFVLDIPAAVDRDEAGLPLNPGVEMPLVLINPEIVGSSAETAVSEEGCLSFPELYVPVERPVQVAVRFLDRDGATRWIEARGLLARAVQHEMDHLNGVLLVDRLSAAGRIKHGGLLRRLRKMSATNEAEKRA